MTYIVITPMIAIPATQSMECPMPKEGLIVLWKGQSAYASNHRWMACSNYPSGRYLCFGMLEPAILAEAGKSIWKNIKCSSHAIKDAGFYQDD